MKVTSINFDESLGFSIEDVNGLLYNDIKNDYVFEKSYITIFIEDTNPIDVLYRKYWEDVYLQNDDEHKSSYKESKFKMVLSLNEVMMYINKATPPRLHNLIDTIKSVDDIIKTLEEFLIVESDMLITYHSFFKEVLHFYRYETTKTPKLSNSLDYVKNQFIQKCKNRNNFNPVIVFKYSHDNDIPSKVIKSYNEDIIDNNGINIFNCLINEKNDKIIIEHTVLLIQEMKGSISHLEYDDINGIFIVDIVNNTGLIPIISHYMFNSYKRISDKNL